MPAYVRYGGFIICQYVLKRPIMQGTVENKWAVRLKGDLEVGLVYWI